MDKRLLLMLFLFVPSALAISVTINDTYSSANCGDSTFSCGTTNDAILNTGGSYNVTIASTGNSDFLCAIFVNNSIATVKTCIARQGLTNASCDIDAGVAAGNHSDYYVCSNGLNCSWGAGGIPLFGDSVTSRSFQIMTSGVISEHVIFTSFNCTTGDSLQVLNTYFRVVNSKGVVCVGNDYASVVFDSFGTSVMTMAACNLGEFCEPSFSRNYSVFSIINDTFCTQGCYDHMKNGGETDIDYGGIACGNCSPNGKASDERYPIARELQDEQGLLLTTATPFNESYCQISQDTTGGIIGTLVILLLVSAFMIFLLIIVISFISGVVITGIVIYLKNKRKKGN